MSIRKKDEESDLGYRFIPARYPHPIGHARLEINILCAPSEKHFDPKIVQLPIFTSADSVHPNQIEQLKVFHPWAYRDTYQVAPGLVNISDRKGKKVAAFTFGGALTIEMDENCTTCIIQSDAPIIEVASARPAVRQFIEEVEILLAERRVSRVGHLIDFEARLESVTVPLLYAALLMELQKKYDELHSSESIVGPDFMNIIEGEIEYMKNNGRWPEDVPSLSDIL